MSASAAQSAAAAMRRANQAVRIVHTTAAPIIHGEATRDTAQGCVAAAICQWGTRAVQTAESVAAVGPTFRTHRDGRTQEMQTITMEVA
eukprot:2814932-Prorocentrum_lima.AAC.1